MYWIPDEFRGIYLGCDDEAEFRARFRHTPLWRAHRRGLLRSAAIVLGNQRAGEAAPALIRGLDDAEPLLYGEEPILRDGETVGYLRSGAYGHTLGGAVGFGYVENSDGVTKDFIESGTWTIRVASDDVDARASFRSMYDPFNERVRA